MRLWCSFFVISAAMGLIHSHHAWAYTPDDVIKNRTILIELSGDLEQELSSYDEFRKNPELLKKARNVVDHWIGYLKDPTTVRLPANSEGDWNLFFKSSPNPENFSVAQPRGPPSRLETIASAIYDSIPEHSMEDIQTYVSARLGVETAAILRSEKIPVLVYSGNESGLATSLVIDPNRLIPIPSFYEKWGISKWLELRKTGAPRLIISVPPILQYANHYSAMLAMAGVKDVTVILNSTDRENYLNNLEDLSRKLISRLPASPDYVVLGYTPQWKAILGKLSRVQNFQVEDVHGYFYRLNSSKQLPRATKILLLSADRTLWGEATASLVQGVLPSRPHTIYFMGSAGGITDKVHLYDYTVPAHFSEQDGKVININNVIGSAATQELTHGNSNSPAEQTLAKVDALIRSGVDTVDVEQSLIAKAIDNFNRGTSNQVRFGAINLITDLPGSTVFGYRGENNLDRVDFARKEAARRRIVGLGFQSIQADVSNQPFSLCDSYLLRDLP